MPLETTRYPYHSSITLDRRMPTHGRWRESSRSSGSSNLYISSHALSGLDTSSTYAPSPLSSISLYLPPRSNTSTSYSHRPLQSEYLYASNRTGTSHISPAMVKRNGLIGTLTRNSDDLKSEMFLSQDAVSLRTSTESYLPSSIRSTFSHSTSKLGRTYFTTDLGSSLQSNSSSSYNSNAMKFNNQTTTFRNAYRPIVIDRPSIANFVPRPREERMKLPTRLVRRDRPLIKFLEREDLNPAKVRNLLSAWARGENLDEDGEEKYPPYKKDSVRSNDSGISSVRGSRRSRQKSGDFGMEIDESEIQGDISQGNIAENLPEANSPGLDEGVHLETDEGISSVTTPTLKYQHELEKDYEHDKNGLNIPSLNRCEPYEQNISEDNMCSKRKVRIHDHKNQFFYENNTKFKDENNNISPSEQFDNMCEISNCVNVTDRACLPEELSSNDVSESLKRKEYEYIQQERTEEITCANIIHEQTISLDSGNLIREENEDTKSAIVPENIQNDTAISNSGEVPPEIISKLSSGKNEKLKTNSFLKNTNENKKYMKSEISQESHSANKEQTDHIPCVKTPSDNVSKQSTVKKTRKKISADTLQQQIVENDIPKQVTTSHDDQQPPFANNPQEQFSAKKSFRQITVNEDEKKLTWALPPKQNSKIIMENEMKTDENKEISNLHIDVKKEGKTDAERQVIYGSMKSDVNDDRVKDSAKSRVITKTQTTLKANECPISSKQTVQKLKPIRYTPLKSQTSSSTDIVSINATKSLIQKTKSDSNISERNSIIEVASTICKDSNTLMNSKTVAQKQKPDDVKGQESKPTTNICSKSSGSDLQPKNKEKISMLRDRPKVSKKEDGNANIDLTVKNNKIGENQIALQTTNNVTIEISNKCEIKLANETNIEPVVKSGGNTCDKTQASLYTSTAVKSRISEAILSLTPNTSGTITTCDSISATDEKSENDGKIAKSTSENLSLRTKPIDVGNDRTKLESKMKTIIIIKNNDVKKENDKHNHFKAAKETTNDLKKVNDVRRSTTSPDISQAGKKLAILQKSFTTDCYNTVNKYKTDECHDFSDKVLLKGNERFSSANITKPCEFRDNATRLRKKSETLDKAHVKIKINDEKLENGSEKVDRKLRKHTELMIDDAKKSEIDDSPIKGKSPNLLVDSSCNKKTKIEMVNSKGLISEQTVLKDEVPVITFPIDEPKSSENVTDTNSAIEPIQKSKDIAISDEKSALFAMEPVLVNKLLVQRSISNSEVATQETRESNTSTLKRVNSLGPIQTNTECHSTMDILQPEEKLETGETPGSRNKEENSQKRKILKYAGVNKLKTQNELKTTAKRVTKPQNESDNIRKEVKMDELAITSKYPGKDLLEGSTISRCLKEIIAVNETTKVKADTNVHIAELAFEMKTDSTLDKNKKDQTLVKSHDSPTRERHMLSETTEIAVQTKTIRTLKDICQQSSQQQINSKNISDKSTNNFCIEKVEYDIPTSEHRAQSNEKPKNIYAQKGEDENTKEKTLDDITTTLQSLVSNSKNYVEPSKSSQLSGTALDGEIGIFVNKAIDPRVILQNNVKDSNQATIICCEENFTTEKVSSESIKPMVKKKKPKTEGTEEKVKKKKKKKEVKTDEDKDDGQPCTKNKMVITVDETKSDTRTSYIDSNASADTNANFVDESHIGGCLITEKPEVLELITKSTAVLDTTDGLDSTTSLDSTTASDNTTGLDRTSAGLDDLWYDYNELTTECPKTLTKILKQPSLRRRITIDKFNFLKVLGRGSYGKVMLAELKGRNEFFAIKCLKKAVVLADNDVECTMIEREVLAMGSNHPYLCTLYWTFQDESHLFFVMEYLSGGDLMFHIQQSGRFEQERARFYAAEIICALKYLHKHGIIYRDAKLDNICIDSDGHVRLVDFGFCKLRIYRKECLPRNLCGTPDYMAPEIIKGHQYNQSVDWWSMGVLLYEMLIGQSPFNGTDEEELFWSICNENVSYPRFLTVEARQLLSLLLDKDPEKRLGMPGCHTGDIYHQPFFHSIDWRKVEKKQLEPPFKPKLKSKTDVSNFDSDFTTETAILTPTETSVLRSLEQHHFAGFTFTNPNVWN